MEDGLDIYIGNKIIDFGDNYRKVKEGEEGDFFARR